MGAPAAPVLINIYDSDMTHEFVVESRATARAANSNLSLQQHGYIQDTLGGGGIKATLITFLNILCLVLNLKELPVNGGAGGVPTVAVGCLAVNPEVF